MIQHYWRNIVLLSSSQALMMSANSMIIASAALVGLQLAPDGRLATLPLALQFIATMVTTIPASFLLAKLGRRRGFMLASTLALSGSVIAAIAIVQHHFWLFALGTICIGSFNAFANYFRFTAADSVDEQRKSIAISYVLAGGVVAAIVGPNLAALTRDIGTMPFAVSYAALFVVYSIMVLALFLLRLPEHADKLPLAKIDEPVRPWIEIVTQARFLVAILSAMFGYAVMSLVMTATPLSMDVCGYPFNDTSWVIQWHVLGMFAPSFFTGHLIRRFGVLTIIVIGALLELSTIIINLHGVTVMHFWTALFCLGVGWNFLFIGGTTLLTETYTPAERSKVQATNDFGVFTSVATASLLAGTLQFHWGWQTVNWIALPMVMIILLAVGLLLIVEKRQKGEAYI